MGPFNFPLSPMTNRDLDFNLDSNDSSRFLFLQYGSDVDVKSRNENVPNGCDGFISQNGTKTPRSIRKRKNKALATVTGLGISEIKLKKTKKCLDLYLNRSEYVNSETEKNRCSVNGSFVHGNTNKTAIKDNKSKVKQITFGNHTPINNEVPSLLDLFQDSTTYSKPEENKVHLNGCEKNEDHHPRKRVKLSHLLRDKQIEECVLLSSNKCTNGDASDSSSSSTFKQRGTEVDSNLSQSSFLSGDLSSFSTGDLSSFSTDDLSSFSTGDLSSFSTDDLSSFSTDDLSSFSTDDLSSFSTDDATDHEDVYNSAQLSDLSSESELDLPLQNPLNASPFKTPFQPGKAAPQTHNLLTLFDSAAAESNFIQDPCQSSPLDPKLTKTLNHSTVQRALTSPPDLLDLFNLPDNVTDMLKNGEKLTEVGSQTASPNSLDVSSSLDQRTNSQEALLHTEENNDQHTALQFQNPYSNALLSQSSTSEIAEKLSLSEPALPDNHPTSLLNLFKVPDNIQYNEPLVPAPVPKKYDPDRKKVKPVVKKVEPVVKKVKPVKKIKKRKRRDVPRYKVVATAKSGSQQCLPEDLAKNLLNMQKTQRQMININKTKKRQYPRDSFLKDVGLGKKVILSTRYNLLLPYYETYKKRMLFTKAKITGFYLIRSKDSNEQFNLPNQTENNVYDELFEIFQEVLTDTEV